MLVSYAQNFEDVILWRALKGEPPGCYVDIGAHDPVVDSVSMAFYERGWRGVHVEPMPSLAAKLREARPDEKVIEAAVTTSAAPVELAQIGLSGLTTGVPEIKSSHAAAGWPVEPLIVETTTLARVLEECASSNIHWMKIDVEGMEQLVLQSWGDSQIRPWIVVVESTLPLSQVPTHGEWEHHMLDRDYEFVYFDGLNRFYLHRARGQLRPAFGPGPNLWDEFAIAGTATSATRFGAVYIEKLAQAATEKIVLEAKRVEAVAEVAAMREGVEIGERQLADARAEIEALQVSLLVAKSKLEEVETAKRSVTEQLDLQSKSIAKSDAAIRELSGKLAAATERSDALGRDLCNVGRDIAGLRVELQRSHRESRALRAFSRQTSKMWQKTTGAVEQLDSAPLVATTTRRSLDISIPATEEASMQTMRDLLFPGVATENWQMMPWEQIALTGLLARIRPSVALEIGVYYGGSLSLTSQFVGKSYAIDIDPDVRKRFAKPDNVELIIGDSAIEIPAVLNRIEKANEALEFVLIDADHSSAGVQRDINLILQYTPKRPMIILMHDSGNPDCRSGIRSVNWSGSPYVQSVDLDFVPGQIIEHTVASGKPECWGGFAIAYLGPEVRSHDLVVQASAETSVSAIHRLTTMPAHS